MAKHKALPPVELLRERLHYDPATGRLTWAKPRNNCTKPGDTAGSLNSQGYRQVYFDDGSYGAHRLAWAMHHGVDPGEMEIDHINGDRGDNRIGNLRLATKSANMHNARAPRNNTSGAKGVWKAGTKFTAEVCHDGTRHNLGVFPTIEEAAAAVRVKREKLLGEFAHHG
jgi:hypothetical protein